MKCPFCAALNTQVRDSRPTEEDKAVRRRRHCEACDGRFTTFERVQFRELIVVKSSGSRQPFDRDKMARSIKLATRKRQVSAEEMESWINRTVEDIEKSGEAEVTSREIGRLIMQNLLALDPVAYVRFASVYENFQNVEDFQEVLQEIGKSKK